MLTQATRRAGIAMAATAFLTFGAIPIAAADDGATTPSAAPSNQPATEPGSPAGDPDPQGSAEPTTDPDTSPGTAPSEGAGSDDESSAPQPEAEPTPEAVPTSPPDQPDTAPQPEPTDPDAPDSNATDNDAPAAPTSRAATRNQRIAAECAATGPQDVSDSLSSITLSDTELEAYERVRVDFAGSLPEGVCAGDTVTITLPPELRASNTTYPVTAGPGGTVLGQMVVRDGVATITFNDNAQRLQNVRYQGFLEVTVRPTVEPGESYDLEFEVGDEVFTTPVTTDPCPECNEPITRVVKYADYDEESQSITWGIRSVPTRTADEEIVMTDRVSAGQAIDCDEVTVERGTRRDNWGTPVFTDDVTDSAQIDCSESEVTASFTATAEGEFYRLRGISEVTDFNLDSYRDDATVTQSGRTLGDSATARAQDGGVSADGDQPAPKIDIEKWSTTDGPGAGDYDSKHKALDADKAEKISFTITNNGAEALRQVVVSDKTTDGSGTVRGLTCDFSPLGGPATGRTWDGPFRVGDSFTCTGTLPALGANATHSNTATVSGIGVRSGVEVDDDDPWNGETQPPVAPVPPNDSQVLGNTAVRTPVQPTAPTTRPAGLPETGSPSGLLPMGVAAAALVVAGVLALRRGRRTTL